MEKKLPSAIQPRMPNLPAQQLWMGTVITMPIQWDFAKDHAVFRKKSACILFFRRHWKFILSAIYSDFPRNDQIFLTTKSSILK